jgi:phosphatidylserine/phosphatidylglycerophosphate/cardiolipin synthase-like enzyme
MYSLIPDEKYAAAARFMIGSAKTEILISTFKIQRPTRRRAPDLISLLDLVCERARQGVQVSFLMNWNDTFKGVAKTNAPVASAFRAAGVDVRYLQGGRCAHAKILICDRRAMILGSHNWSVQAFTLNFELSLLVEDEQVILPAVEIYGAAFKTAKKWL